MTPRILVVEDSPGVQKFCREVLEMDGFSVETAGSLAEARALYSASKPHLAIIDIGLPDGNGLALLSEWQASPGPVPPILFFTGSDELQTRLDCFKAGARDYVTKPCAAEELVARVRVHLEIERSQTSLSERNRELELITRAKQDAADMIVHDLKAPLSSIKGTLQLIAAHGLITKKSHASLLDNAGSAADFMLLMLNDLLDVGAAQAGGLKPVYASMDVAELFAKLEALFAGKLEILKMKLKTSVKGVTSIESDQNLLYRVLVNLISNACKVSRADGVVELECAPGASATVRFKVSDRGNGVADQDKKKIFQKYVTTGRQEAAVETGSGIGLAFCQAAASALSGRIWVEDREGGGAVFAVEVPVSAPRRG